MNLIELLHEAENRENMSNEDIVRLISRLEGARNRLHATDLTVDVNLLNLYDSMQKREPQDKVKS